MPYSAPDVPEPAPLYQPINGLERLRETALALGAAHQMAQALVRTGFVPTQFKGKPDEAAAAMLAGAEVGLSPLASLRSFDLINGVATPRAQTLRAIAQSQGHHVWVEESSEHRAVVCGRRRGSDKVEQVTWSMDRARKAGLAGKATWQTHPEAMLVARATAEVCRRIASDALLGVGYATEELDDPSEAPRVTVQRRPVAAPRVAQRAPAPALTAKPEPEPEAAPVAADDDEADDDQPQEEAPAVTSSQLKMLGALMRQRGLTERLAALQYVEGVVDRPIQSRNDLSKHEASLVIDALQADLAMNAAGEEPDLDEGSPA